MINQLEKELDIRPSKKIIEQEIKSTYTIPYLNGLDLGTRRRLDLSGKERDYFQELIRQKRLKLITKFDVV